MARTPRAPLSSSVPGTRATRRRAALALVACAALLAGSARAHAQACAHAIEYGINPSFQTWTSRAIVFADAMQRARGFSYWSNGPLASAPVIPLGSNERGAGWPDPSQLGPGERYGAMLFGSMEGTLPDGRVEPWVVTWLGAGEARLEGANVAGERDRSAQRVEVLVDPTLGTGNGLLSISWSASDPADPVRDVHVWLPGMEGSQRIFWPPFLEKVRATNAGRGPHTWRTLDWTRVNAYGRSLAHGGFVFDRAGVITPASPSQGTLRGVATAYQVALCNELGMNLHVQLPHRANDMAVPDYVGFLIEQLLVIRDGAPGVAGLYGGRAFAPLDPALTVTVELSNEIWNALFPVCAWMSAEAARKGIPFTQQVAHEIQLLFDVAEAVFAGPHAPRLRTYVAGFVADPAFTRRILEHLRPGTRVDALGPAAYLAPRRADMDAWLEGSDASSCPSCPTADELLATADAAVDVLRANLAEHRAIAGGWLNPDGSHPALELYEGGLNLKSIGMPWAAAARDVQRDPRLFDLFAARYVPMLIDEGVELVNWYSFMSDQDSTTVDAYGLWNDMEQTLTQPVARPYLDEGAPKAAVVCLGPPLASSCPLATATRRDGAGNLSSFTVTPPVMGASFRAQVDLAPSGDQAAFAIVSLRAVSIPLSSGQTLLAGPTRAELLPLRPGPLVTWDVRVPNDARLAGVALASQAFQLGSSGVRLTNAVDLVLGR